MSTIGIFKEKEYKSRVLEFPPEHNDKALAFFKSKLHNEVDPSDVFSDKQNGIDSFILIDARSEEAYKNEHIPGAINLPYRKMNEETTASLPKNKIIVVYCDGIGCNASTKGSYKMTKLGFKVKELIGGIEWWKFDGYQVEKDNDQINYKIDCGC